MSILKNIFPDSGTKASKSVNSPLHTSDSSMAVNDHMHSKKLIRAVFDASQDALFIIQDGTIIDCNAKTLSMFDCKREEFIGQQPHLLSPKRQNNGRLSEHEAEKKIKAALHGKPQFFHWVHKKRDATPFDAKIGLSSYSHLGETYIVATVRDLTDRKKAKAALAKSEAKYRTLVENANEAILVAQDGLIKFNNAKAEQLVDSTHKELLGKPFADFIYAADKQMVMANYKKRLQNEPADDSYNFRIVSKSNQTKWVRINVTLIEWENRPATLNFLTNITSQVNAESTIKELNATLQLHIQRMPIGVIVFDPDFKVTSWNPAAEHIFEYSADEMIGTHSLDKIIPEQIKDDIEKIWQRLQNGDTPEKYINENLTKNNRTILCQWMNTPLLDDNGKFLGVLSTAQDITEKKNAEKQVVEYQTHLEELVKERTFELELKTDKMKQAQKAMRYLVEDANEARQQVEETNDLLSESNRQLESFAYSVSHDLRAPLRAISGFANKLSRLYKDILDSEGQRILNVINDNTKKMSQLIDDLLAFSRISRTLVSTTEVDMTVLATDICVELQTEHPLIDIDFNITPLHKTLGDQRLLRQALYNLVENAVKYSSQKETPHVHISMVDNDGECAYCVRDNGVGFDMKYVDKLFNVFQRLHAESEFKGTGVGLAITQLIINRHNGRIWADAKPDKGAAFYFTLPVADENKVEAGN